jgi:hypothetical protein
MSLEPTLNNDLDHRYRRALGVGIVVALLVHVVAFLAFRSTRIPQSPFAAAGPRSGDDRAAAGGGMQALQLSPPQPVVIPRPPEPLVPTELAVELPQQEEPKLEAPRLDLSLKDLEGQAGHNQGPAIGPGLPGGTGSGDGGTANEGRFHVVPPRVRGLIWPPDPPAAVRGKKVTVWVFVTAKGRVVADSTRLQPPTGDRGYDRKLRDQAARWVFDPALKNGKPVAEWFPYTITM